MSARLQAGQVTLRRDAIEALVETLLAVLDDEDGDPDLEEDDPSGDPLDRGEEDGCDHRTLPRYGRDQSRGPVNCDEAHEARLIAMGCGRRQ